MICEHGNEISPQMAKTICRMPDSWYKRVAGSIDPDKCLFVTEAIALEAQAKKLAKKG